jgi:hypothetical protein
MHYFSFFLLVFGLVFLVVLPHVLWIRWIMRAFRQRRIVGRVVAPLSYLLFLMPWTLLFQGNQRSRGRFSELLSEDSIFIGLVMGSLLLPILYCYARWVYAAYRQKARKALYFRLGLLLLIPATGVLVSIGAELARRSEISTDLGVAIPYWGTKLTKYSESKSGFRREGEVLAEIELDADAFEDLAQQLRETEFYDSSKQVLHGGDELAWAQSDTVFYWKVRNHLEKNKRTGLWVYDPERKVYEFYEPNLSDIPNAAILFEESYVISAELNLKNRTLVYKRWEY